MFTLIQHRMKRSGWIMTIVCLGVMAALIVDPARYTQSIKDGLKLFTLSVLPSMLPFFFLTGLLTATGLAVKLAKKGGKILAKLYGAPAIGLYVMLMSCLSGYPVGAKLTAELYEKGLLTQEGAKRILPFTSATGPMFVVGAVGAGLLGSAKAGLVIAGAHYLATFLNGLLYRRNRRYEDTPLPLVAASGERLLWDTALNTATSLLVAGVFIVVFNLLADVADDLLLTTAVTNELVVFGLPQGIAHALTMGLFEMTRGCALLAELGSVKTVVPLCAFLVSFGGLSVTLQSVAYLARCKVSAGYYLLTKTTQSLLALGLAYLLSLAL